MEPTLSIIVPIYNVGKYLDECVNSILAQTFTDFELILVDDGSTDGSGAICDAFAERDRRVRVLHKKNGGVVSARQEGVLAAKGRYVGYVDGDDWIENDMYERLVYYMDKYNCDMAMCDIVHEDTARLLETGGTTDNIDDGYYDLEKMKARVFPTMVYSGRFYEFGIYPVVWNKLYKRDKLIKHQCAVDKRITIGDDTACVFPYILDSESMYFIKGVPLYHYRHPESSMTAVYDKIYFDRIKILYGFFRNTPLAASEYGGQLDYYYAYTIKTCISNELNPTNPQTFGEKLKHIKDICAFARKERFLEDLDIKQLQHKIYFDLIRRNRPLLLIICFSFTKTIQRLFRRRQ